MGRLAVQCHHAPAPRPRGPGTPIARKVPARVGWPQAGERLRKNQTDAW